MSERSTQVEQSVEMAERHLVEHIENGEQETMSHISSNSGHSDSSKNKSRTSYVGSESIKAKSRATC